MQSDNSDHSGSLPIATLQVARCLFHLLRADPEPAEQKGKTANAVSGIPCCCKGVTHQGCTQLSATQRATPMAMLATREYRNCTEPWDPALPVYCSLQLRCNISDCLPCNEHRRAMRHVQGPQ